MSRFGKLCFVVGIVFAVALAVATQAAPGASLATSLSVDKWRFEGAEPLAISFSVTNTAAESVSVLRWDTPIDGVEGNIFRVERDGKPVDYIGKLYKRAAPQAEDYFELLPGETMTFVFDPSTAYDMSAPGEYTVRYRGDVRHSARFVALREEQDAATDADSCESNEVSLYFSGREPADLVTEHFKVGALAKYTKCTTTQQSKLVTAESNATRRSGLALSYLTTNTTDSKSLYKTWFDFSGAKYGWSTVKNHYSTINAAFAGGKATFNCGCNQNAYAYVYPTKPYQIYLCKVFWTAPADTYPDTQAGTLVHEMSHFNVTAGTNDWAYGVTNAQNFAKTDPGKATTNADNHEYFAEKQ